MVREQNSIIEYQGNAIDEIGVIWVKPVPMSLHLLQIFYFVTRDGTRTSKVEDRRLATRKYFDPFHCVLR